MLPGSTRFSVTTPANGACSVAYDRPIDAARDAAVAASRPDFASATRASAPREAGLRGAQPGGGLVQFVLRRRVPGAQVRETLERDAGELERGLGGLALGLGTRQPMAGGGLAGGCPKLTGLRSRASRRTSVWPARTRLPGHHVHGLRPPP